jgi:PIN domain nuclease of toxin-antitoxin system
VNLFDAAALLCFLQGETGADTVERELTVGGACSAANWSEVAQRVGAAGGDWSLSRALLQSFGIVVEPVTELDGEWAAVRWRRGEGLSLGDRLCLAVGHRLGATVWTADKAWGRRGNIKQIR